MSPYIVFFMPALAAYGTWLLWSRAHGGLAFAYAALAFIFVVIPLADVVAARMRRRAPSDGPRTSEKLIVLMSLPLQVCNLFFFSWFISSHDLAWYEGASVLFVGGIMSALYAQNPAHELIHHGTRFERVIGTMLFSTSIYSGAKLAHVHSHHLLVATSADPTSAKYGQSLYAFLPGAVAVNLFGWWGPKEKKSLLRRKVVLENMLGYAMSIGWACAIGMLYGPKGLVFFLLQSCIGILVLEMMNYIGHYGLERRVDASGRLEAVCERHAWDCDLPFSNLALISVQKHSDHHINPHKEYGELRCTDNSPRLPLSYPLLFLLTLFPFLWRRVIHPRLDAYRERHGSGLP